MEEIPIQTKSNKNGLFGSIIVIILIILAGVYALLRNSRKTDVVVQDTTVQTPDITKQIQTTPAIVNKYKDGTYSAVGDYVSPGGDEQIGLQITLKGDVIVDAKVESKAFRKNTIKFQGIFISNFSPFVVGKKIDEVFLDKVSGSSLTPKGFNDALQKIKVEAKA